MKVNDLNTAQIASNAASQAGESERAKHAAVGGGNRTGASGGADSPDQVAISQIGARLRAASVDSPQRTAHVAALGTQVASGQYQPQDEAVAARLVEAALGSQEPFGASL